MAKAADLLGQRFGRLLVVASEGSKNFARQWRCLCDCGNESISNTNALRSGCPRSCGCLRNESASKRFTKHGAAKNGKLLPEYRAWLSMNTRCKYKNRKDFKWYGSKGVTVCQEWQQSFEAFRSHIGPRPSPQHSVDRINPFGNYEPGNVRWATRVQQANNKRKSRENLVLCQNMAG